MDDVKIIKRARGSRLLEFINVKCLAVVSSLRWLFCFVNVLIDIIVRHFRTLEHAVDRRKGKSLIHGGLRFSSEGLRFSTWGLRFCPRGQ